MGETTGRAYRDDFCVHHSSLEEVLAYTKETEESDKWTTVSANEIEFFALSEDLSKVDEMVETFFFSDEEGPLVEDTMKNMGLIAVVGTEFLCVRQSAFKTILDRAKISGNALGRLPRKDLADILNYCMLVSRGDALVYRSHGKVSAMHGGDKSDYCVLPISELYEALREELEERFPGNCFWSGYSDHCFSTAIWTLPEQKEDLLGSYEKELDRHGITGHTLIPGIRFTTSNTAMSGANIYPYITDTKRRTSVRLSTAIKVPHKNEATVVDFKKEVELLFPKFIDASKALNRLLGVDLFYPVNAMAEVMKQIKIPKKIAFETLESFRIKHGEGSSTAHEAFWGISEATFFMRADGASEAKVAETEDKIARALHINWKEYDIGGAIAA